MHYRLHRPSLHAMSRLLFVLGTLTLVLGLTVTTTVDKANARNIICSRNIYHHWNVKDGPKCCLPQLGWVELHIEVCTDGGQITSSSATVDNDTTFWGAGEGYRISMSTPSRVGFNSGGFAGGYVKYRSDVRVKVCTPVLPLVCSATEDFAITGELDMLNQLLIYPTGTQFLVHGRVFAQHWNWFCMNDRCVGNTHLG